jgi:sensor histidine kinase YesM
MGRMNRALIEDEDPPNFHPLELIPYFRRFPCSRTRDLIYTFIWNCLFAVFFIMVNMTFTAKLPSARAVMVFFTIANLIGYAIHALFEGGEMFGVERWVRRRGYAAKALYYSLVPLTGVIAGMQAADWIFDIGFGSWLASPEWVLVVGAVSIVISFVLSTVAYLRQQEARAQVDLALEREKNERVERESIAANLRALQAQVEPHFLFNTLANVSSLVDRDPARAKHMLERFIRFLRASLAATRTERTTLAAERELITAYLDVLSVRMEARLSYRIDIPAEVEGFALPPMLLQPLVENAIRHGLEPKVAGGTVEIVARRVDGQVSIDVRDTGVGFGSSTKGGGVGLDNVRSRLRGLYGERAGLSIAENRPGGTVVTVHVPA